MNESKKLLYVRIVVTLVVLIIVGLFVFLIVKIDVIGHLFNNRNYIRIASNSNLDRYISELDSREYEEKKREKKVVEEKKKEKKEEIVDKSIFKFIDAIKNKKKFNSLLNSKNILSLDLKSNSKKLDIEKQKEIEKEVKKIQNFYDSGYYPKSSLILIDEDNDGYGYNYFFNEKGKFSVDTVSHDYRVIDSYGREIDDDLEPISYKIENISTESNANVVYVNKGLESHQTIITEGVKLKNSDNIYDNKMNRKVIDYIDTSLRFKKTTNATIYDGSKWKSVSSLRDDDGYVIFNNPKNNFNKVVGKITTQKISEKDDTDTYATLYVYDADLYELYRGYEDLLEPLYETSAFNYSEPLDFSFTFYRTVKRLRFQIETDGDRKLRTCYLKDLRFGFDKAKYKEELEEARDKEEYIAYMKELGLYQSDEEFLLELKSLEEDSESDYLEYEDFNDIDLYRNVDLSDYGINYDREQLAIDRRTGPAFDEYLRSLKNYWEIEYGPGYEN